MSQNQEQAFINYILKHKDEFVFGIINENTFAFSELRDILKYYFNYCGTRCTPLMFCSLYARKYGLEQFVPILLDAGAKLDLQSRYGCTALTYASIYSNTTSTEQTVRMLLDAGANADIQNNIGWTALMKASRFSKKKSTEGTIRILLDAGANVNIQNKEGCSALMIACEKFATESTETTVRMLLKSGANTNLQTNDKAVWKVGWTALFYVCDYAYNNSINIIHHLLAYGADITIQDYKGRLCFEVCRDSSALFNKLYEIIMNVSSSTIPHNIKSHYLKLYCKDDARMMNLYLPSRIDTIIPFMGDLDIPDVHKENLRNIALLRSTTQVSQLRHLPSRFKRQVQSFLFAE